MTTVYTKIAKPTGTAYTKVSGGYHLYDDTMDIYDDPNVTYDGLNRMSAWTDIAKPSNGELIATAGLFMGLGALTYSGGEVLSSGIWTKIAKGV
jgi:hypothetical protein